MKLLDVIKSKGFIAAVSGAVVLICQSFGLSVDAPLVNEAITSFSAAILIIGSISLAKKTSTIDEVEEESKNIKEDNGNDNDKA